MWAQTSEEAIAEGIRRSLEQSKPVECLAEEMTWRRVHGKRRRWAWARSFVDEVALRARREPRKFHVFLTHDWGQDELGRANHERVQKVNALLNISRYQRRWPKVPLHEIFASSVQHPHVYAAL